MYLQGRPELFDYSFFFFPVKSKVQVTAADCFPHFRKVVIRSTPVLDGACALFSDFPE